MESKPTPWYRVLRTSREPIPASLAVLTVGWVLVVMVALAAEGIITLFGGDVDVTRGSTWLLVVITGVACLGAGILVGYVTGYRRREREGPLPDHETPIWVGPLARRRYWRPVVYRKDLKLTKREYDKLTPEQKDGSAYLPISRRQQRRMDWLNRPGGPNWEWHDNGEDAWCVVRDY